MVNGVISIPVPGRRSSNSAIDARSRTSLFALDSFLAGPENNLARVAAETLLAPKPSEYHPLVVVGPAGAGKTHLARGLAQHWLTHQPGRAVICECGRGFASELAEAIENDTLGKFRRRHRTAALWVLDGLEQLIRKPAAQTELLTILDALSCSQAIAVVTSRTNPQEISKLPPQLKSRLVGGLVVPLSLPAAATRSTAVDRLAGDLGITITAAAAKTLASKLEVGVGQLRETLLKLAGNRLSIDVPAVQQYLSGSQSAGSTTLQKIIATTARHFGFKAAELRGESRSRSLVAARSIALFLARELTDSSFKQIGRAMGRRDHSTVMHSVRKVERFCRTDVETRKSVERLRELLQE